MESQLIELRRGDSSAEWGFDLAGGQGTTLPIHVKKIDPTSIGRRKGMDRYDVILEVGGLSTKGLSLSHVKSEIMRAGNELDLTVAKGVLQKSNIAAASKDEPRSEVVQERILSVSGEGYTDVVPKTYKIVNRELGNDREGTSSNVAARPASIFDRKRQDRSKYLNEESNPFQKVYGEK